MRQAKILFKDEEAGILTQDDTGFFTFRYHDSWLTDSNKPSISLTLPKMAQTFQSKFLFPFFYHLLPEGTNKQFVSKCNRIDQNDDFGLLMTTAKYDSIGAINVIKIDNP